MFSIHVSLPVRLGQLTYHTAHPTRPGTIVGVVLRPSVEVIVRWRDATTTFELVEDLMMTGLVA